MDYKNDYSGLKFRVHNAKKIWKDYDDERSYDEKQKVISEEITEALRDYNVIFHYSDSGTMFPVYNEIYVYDRDTDNLVLESGEFGEPNGITFMTISRNSLDEIKAILHSGQWLLKVKESEITGPMITDGTIQEFFFRDGELSNLFTTNNFGFQSTFNDDKKDRELKTALNSILDALKKDGMPKNFFDDEEV